MAIQKLYNTGETLLSVHTDAYFFPVFVPHYSKDDRWNVEVVEEGVDNFHLFCSGPHDIYSACLDKHEPVKGFAKAYPSDTVG